MTEPADWTPESEDFADNVVMVTQESGEIVVDNEPLLVKITVEEDTYDHLNGTREGDVMIEVALSDDLVLMLAFPNAGHPDPDEVASLLTHGPQAIIEALNALEAQHG